MIKPFITLALILLLLAACGEGDRPPNLDQTPAPEVQTATAAETTMPDPTATTEPTVESTTPEVEPEMTPTTEPQLTPASEEAAAVTRALEENISILGAGGLPLQATLFTPGKPDPSPGVMLLHMLGSDRRSWKDAGLVDALLDHGYAVLAVDMRGHGDTGGSPDWNLAPEDLSLVWDYFGILDAVDPQRTAIIGASIGANLALVTAADQPAIRTVVLLSPELEYRGLTTEEPLAQYGSRPLLIVASEEDTYAAASSRTLADEAQGESQLEMYNGAGHGTRMFSAQPDLTGLILDWLDQNLN